MHHGVHKRAGLRCGFYIVCLFLSLSSCASEIVAPPESPRFLRSEAITSRLAQIRKLAFTEEVSVLSEKKQAVTALLKREFLDSYGGEEKFNNVSLAYAKLGLLPADFDLQNSLINFLADNVAGFYSVKTKKIVLAAPSGILYSSAHQHPDGRAKNTALAHELIHALQDQNFPVTERLLDSRNHDKAMAFRAITEGDAILTELAYDAGGIDQDSLIAIRQAIEDIPTAPEPAARALPALLADRFRFPYEAGASFVYRVFQQKGWAGVNLLYRFPPLSTEQLLHPEKYFDLPDPPTQVVLGDLSGLFPSGWELIENNTLGELLIVCLFKSYLPSEAARVLAVGWDGDRFVAFRRGRDISFLWVTVWDSPGDAEKFTSGYQQIVSKRQAATQASKGTSYLERRNHVVMVTEGLETSQIQAQIQEVWRGIKLKEDFTQSVVDILARRSSVPPKQ